MTNRPLQIFAWATLAIIIFMTVCPIGLRPSDIFPVNVDRALASALLAATFVMAYPKHWLRIGAAMIVCAGTIELLQLLSASRHARLEDALVKASGAVLGVALALVINALRSHSIMRHASRTTGPLRLPTASKALPVTSRMIEAVYFNREDGQLRLRFRDGGERIFAGVTEAEATALVTAPSPGQHYLDHIRPRYKRMAA